VAPSRVVTVTGIPVLGKAELFAGLRRKQDLGRSVVSRGYPPAGEARRRQRMSGGRRGGERRRACAPKAHAPAHAREIVACAWQTRPSLGPSTRARRSSLDARRQKRLVVRRSIRYHGWANPREWEEPTLGPRRNGRCAARRVSPLPRGRGRVTSEKEGGRGLRPCENQELRLGCSHVVFQLQKSSGDAWPRISSAYALQKERSGSSERGPSSERRSAGHTVGGSIEQTGRRASDSPASRGRIGARPRVTRERHPAVTASPKAVQWSRDRGCNGHRILRRASCRWKAPSVITRCFGHAKR